MVERLATLSMALVAAALAACDGATGPSDDDLGTDPVPVYGVPLEPPPGRVVHGMGQWVNYNEVFLDALPAGIRPASELMFITLGDTPRGWWGPRLATEVQAYVDAGFIPHLSLELRGNQPLPSERADLPDPYYGIDDEIADTDAWDDRIHDVIEAVRAIDSPVMVRIGGEFNGAWNGYHPYDYPRAFRKIVRMFREAGVTNAAFVWCYMPAAPGDFDATDAEGEYRWYPGADVIDWYGIDLFDAPEISGPTEEGGRESRYGRTLRFLDMAVADGRPVVVAESAPARYDLADAGAAARAWDEWFRPYFALIERRKEIKWFHLVSYDWSRAAHYQEIGWQNNDLTSDPTLFGRLMDELTRPVYLHGDERHLIPGG